jgi:hypothetical protein
MTAPRRRLRGQSPPPDHTSQTRHQAFIHSLPCLGCGKPASECAQVGTFAGLATPASDRYLVCGPATVRQDGCHNGRHYRGAARFWSALGVEPLEVAVELWRLSGNVKAGRCAVMRVRRPAASRHQRNEGSRCAFDGHAAPRDRSNPTAMVNSPKGSELPVFVESRS